MLNWPQSRLLLVLAAAWILILEPVSWLTSQTPLCIVNAADYGDYYAQNEECPALHIFLIKFATAVFEKLGDPAWATVAATIIMAAFTGTLWWSTHKLWIATNASLNHAEKTTQRQLRAYVLLRKVTIEDIVEGKVPKAQVTIQNSGQTPAYDLTHWAAMDFDTFPRVKEMDMSDPEVMPVHHLGPGGKLQVAVPLDYNAVLSKEQFDALQSGKAALYVLGRTKYIDTFGNAQFTEYVAFIGGPMGFGGGKMAAYYEGHKTSWQ